MWGEGIFFGDFQMKELKKVAVLVDGGHIRKKLKQHHKRHIRAEDITSFARKCLKTTEELFRIYYYDCPPYARAMVNPISGKDIQNKAALRDLGKLSDQLRVSESVAYRSGWLQYTGWQVRESALKDIIRKNRAPEANDLVPSLKQKVVDIKIGLDIAWLSTKAIVERIILVTADSDFVPAMKFARREGMQITVVTTQGHGIRTEIREHADEIRQVNI